MAAQSEEGRWATRHGKVSGRLKSFPGQGDQSRAQGEVIYFIPGGWSGKHGPQRDTVEPVKHSPFACRRAYVTLDRYGNTKSAIHCCKIQCMQVIKTKRSPSHKRAPTHYGDTNHPHLVHFMPFFFFSFFLVWGNAVQNTSPRSDDVFVREPSWGSAPKQTIFASHLKTIKPLGTCTFWTDYPFVYCSL